MSFLSSGLPRSSCARRPCGGTIHHLGRYYLHINEFHLQRVLTAAKTSKLPPNLAVVLVSCTCGDMSFPRHSSPVSRYLPIHSSRMHAQIPGRIIFRTYSLSALDLSVYLSDPAGVRAHLSPYTRWTRKDRVAPKIAYFASSL